LGFVNEDNALEVVTGKAYRELASAKGYNNRKRAHSISVQLKKALLQKYKLSDIPEPVTRPSLGSGSQQAKRRPHHTHQPKQSRKQRGKNIEALSTRKLCKLFK
jgi:hypothetical protein